MKINTVDTVIQDFREGQNIFRRPSVELMVREISRLNNRIEELEQERRWIPVSEKENLPDVGVEILGWEVRRQRYVLDWLANREMLSKKEPTFLFSFDYWQPLPQPPKEGE